MIPVALIASSRKKAPNAFEAVSQKALGYFYIN